MTDLRAATIGALVAFAACGRAPAPSGATPSAPGAPAISAPGTIDTTVDDEEINFLLAGTDAEPGAIRADGLSWPRIDSCPTCPHAPPRISDMINQLRVPRPPDDSLRCDVPAPTSMCELATAPAAEAAGDFAACTDALLIGRGLGRVEGTAIVLTRPGATAVSRSANAKKLEDIALEYSPDLTALAAAAAMAEVSQFPPRDARRATALAWCRALATDLRGTSTPAGVARDLTCLSRAVSGASAHPITTAWAGCRCAARGAKGRTCLEASSIQRPFPAAPVDERMAAALDEAVDRANAELARDGMSIAGLGVVGCHLARFERGAEVRELAERTTPTLRFAQVSEHVLGNACDISYAWVRTSEGKVRGFSVSMLTLAMLDPNDGDFNHAVEERGEWRADVRRMGESAYFASLASLRLKRPDGSVAFALRVGVALRTALVDSGLVVFSPATNSSHGDHFHVHLPLEDAVWAETSDDATDHARRETLIAPPLARAAGVDPSAAPPVTTVETKPIVIGTELRVVNVETQGSGTIITVALGSEDDIAVGDTAVLLDSTGAPIPGGEVTIAKVKARIAYAKCTLSFDQVRTSGLTVRTTARPQ